MKLKKVGFYPPQVISFETSCYALYLKLTSTAQGV
jgi:hypothetical protein